MDPGSIQGTDSTSQSPFELNEKKGILWNTHTITPTTETENKTHSVVIPCFKASS